MRTHKVSESRGALPPVERTYNGFNQRVDPDAKYIVLTSVEGKVETWVLDDPNKCSTFVEFLAEHQEQAKILGLFQRIK